MKVGCDGSRFVLVVRTVRSVSEGVRFASLHHLFLQPDRFNRLNIIMTCFIRFALLSLLLFPLLTWSVTPPHTHRPQPNKSHPPHPPPFRPSGFKYIRKRGPAGIPGDIEYMGFFGSLLAIPTMLSYLGIQTNYNLERSYFNSQINAEYYKQSREMLRAHAAKLIQEQEKKFAAAGQSWPGMIYNKDGEVNGGVRKPMVGGVEISLPQKPEGGGGGGGGKEGSGADNKGVSGEGGGAQSNANVGSAANGSAGNEESDSSGGVVDATKSPGDNGSNGGSDGGFSKSL